MKGLASCLWFLGKSFLAWDLVLFQQSSVSKVIWRCLREGCLPPCIWNCLIDTCKFLDVTHDSLYLLESCEEITTLCGLISATGRGLCHFLQQSLSSCRASEAPLSWLALYSKFQGNYQWIRNSLLIPVFEAVVLIFFKKNFFLVIDILFYLFSAKRVNDSFRS